MTFVTAYKQADLTLTGCMRKAQLTATATKTSRRTVHNNSADSPAPSVVDLLKRRMSNVSVMSHGMNVGEERITQCSKCAGRFSPKWWCVDGSDDDVLCHKCYWRENHGEEDEDEDVEITNGFDLKGSRTDVAV